MDAVLIGITVIIWIISMAVKYNKEHSAHKEDSSSPEEEQAAPTAPGETVFAYYYTHEGQKKVDAAKTNRLNGRQLDEYEIFSEQQRLDKLWCAELERRRTLEDQMREDMMSSVEPVQPPPMEEIISAARLKADREEAAEGSELWDYEPVQTTRNSDRDYQLEQLERWLDAGLIDKAEYKRRKREL